MARTLNWYSARPDEIFLDLDSTSSLMRALKILRVMIRTKVIKAVFHYPTQRLGHSHVIIIRNAVSVDNDIDIRKFYTRDVVEELALVRAGLALWMGSDRLRACYVFGRIMSGLDNADLLVTDRIYHRAPDAMCTCGVKHKKESVTAKCPALKHLLGDLRSYEFFPRAGRKRMESIRVPIGKVPLTLIRKWKVKK